MVGEGDFAMSKLLNLPDHHHHEIRKGVSLACFCVSKRSKRDAPFHFSHHLVGLELSSFAA